MTPEGAGKPILAFRIWYTGDWYEGERYQAIFAHSEDHARRIFEEWAVRAFSGHVWEIVHVD